MLTIQDIVRHYGLKVAYSSTSAMEREVTRVQVDRPGLELNGFFNYHQKKKICLIGNKEVSLMSTLTDDEIYKNTKLIANSECPGIIFTHNNKIPPIFLKACQENDCPVLISSENTSTLLNSLVSYLAEQLAPQTFLHACLLDIYGQGVLFLGESGIGKSEISLELIKKGHRLVSDDKVNIKNVRGHLIGKAPEVIFGMMEVRGIGIIDVGRMFGINSLCAQTEINYAIQLVPFDKKEPLERVGMKTEYIEILGEKRPLVRLPVSAARNMAGIIEAAVTNFKLKSFGYDSAFEFERKISEYYRKGKK